MEWTDVFGSDQPETVEFFIFVDCYTSSGAFTSRTIWEVAKKTLAFIEVELHLFFREVCWLGPTDLRFRACNQSLNVFGVAGKDQDGQYDGEGDNIGAAKLPEEDWNGCNGD